MEEETHFERRVISLLDLRRRIEEQEDPSFPATDDDASADRVFVRREKRRSQDAAFSCILSFVGQGKGSPKKKRVRREVRGLDRRFS